MAICRWVGYLDISITFTCNSKWPEIQMFVRKHGLRAEDMPSIIYRIFKMKLAEMIHCVKKRKKYLNVLHQV